MIYYAKQSINQNDIDEVVKILGSSHLTQGPVNLNFATALCDYVKAKYCLTFNSATTALYAACRALDLGKGDFFWTTPNTFVATANAAVMCRANVDFVDIDSKNFNICPDLLEVKLKKAEKTGALPKVISVVHFAGTPVNMEKVYRLSRLYGFKIIEDASHAIGSKVNNKFVGGDSRTDITVFSFHPVKIITSGEGGAVVTNSDELLEKLKLFQSHGITRNPDLFKEGNFGPWYYEQHELSLNFRMTEIQAALGLSQLEKIESFIKRRNEIHLKYTRNFKDLPIIQQEICDKDRSALHLEIIKTDKRNELYHYLVEQGITCNVHYIPVHTQPFYQNEFGFRWGNFPNSEQYYKSCLSLPMYTDLTENNINHVIDSIRSFYNA